MWDLHVQPINIESRRTILNSFRPLNNIYIEREKKQKGGHPLAMTHVDAQIMEYK